MEIYIRTLEFKCMQLKESTFIDDFKNFCLHKNFVSFDLINGELIIELITLDGVKRVIKDDWVVKDELGNLRVYTNAEFILNYHKKYIKE